MGTTINEMRKYISGKYPSMKWKDKVSKMHTAQVIAVYRSIKNREITERTEKKKRKILGLEEDPHYHQIDMFEYLYSINEGKETHTEVSI